MVVEYDLNYIVMIIAAVVIIGAVIIATSYQFFVIQAPDHRTFCENIMKQINNDKGNSTDTGLLGIILNKEIETYTQNCNAS